MFAFFPNSFPVCSGPRYSARSRSSLSSSPGLRGSSRSRSMFRQAPAPGIPPGPAALFLQAPAPGVPPGPAASFCKLRPPAFLPVPQLSFFKLRPPVFRPNGPIANPNRANIEKSCKLCNISGGKSEEVFRPKFHIDSRFTPPCAPCGRDARRDRGVHPARDAGGAPALRSLRAWAAGLYAKA